jgi:ribosomal-protein-alanine N-acetyltransferase
MVALDDLCFEEPFRFSRAAMLGFAEASNACAVVAESVERVAGFCILHVERVRGQRVGYVVTLDVATEARRRGVATELMQWVEGRAAVAACTEMRLHVFAGNAAAVQFYERRGYLISHRVASFYARGIDALVYHKPLGQLPGIS